MAISRHKTCASFIQPMHTQFLQLATPFETAVRRRSWRSGYLSAKPSKTQLTAKMIAVRADSMPASGQFDT
jgi:hypothetical protein